ncbi:MAG: DUF3488 and transglutaminase-like domain-containing protein [Spongiibacteraceae bacterium]
MTVSWQVPRNCLAWLLLSQFMLIMPHAERLPWWLMVAYISCALWRIMVYQGKWSFPPKSVKVGLALLCLLGIWRSFGSEGYKSMLGLEPTVALLFSGFCLKLLEVNSRRDAYVIIFLAYFVAITEFLFSQDFYITVTVFFTVLLISAALVALHQHGYDQFSIISFKKAGIIFAQALPLMLLLFIVVPRFEPLWKVPYPSHQAKTGVGDTLSPGDISNLSQSDALAFRVVFEGDVPERRSMYWRGLVFSDFDGSEWARGRLNKLLMSTEQVAQVLKQQKNPLRYTIIQEASYRPWLFTLALAYSSDPAVRLSTDFRLINKDDIHSRIRYQVISTPSAKLETLLSASVRAVETKLPAIGNEQARSFAKKIYSQSSGTEGFIQKILNMFNQDNYFYTLNPPLLGDNAVDDFLFNTRRGFCGHYASSFVYLMRAAGIPARVVAGYQGGEINPITGTVLVHQFDAHSWAEVWLEGEGWRRVDPTAAVAPERIEFGLEDAMSAEGSFLADTPMSPLRYRDVKWLNSIRLQLDALSYYWSSSVLQYRGDKQLDVLTSILGKVSPWRMASLVLLVGALVLFYVAFDLLRGRSKLRLATEVRLYLKMCKRLGRAGYPRLPHEGAIAYSQRLTAAKPAWGRHLLQATHAFVTLSYEPLAENERQAMLKVLRDEAAKVSHLL